MIESQQIADNRFLEVLTLEGYSLNDTQAKYPFVPFLNNASEFPQFFGQENQSSNRNIKQLINDPHSNLRIVYFQVFRLADESDDDSFLTNLKRRVFSIDFDIMFTVEAEQKKDVFNDFQFKRFFAEFVTIFQQNTYQPIYDLIQRYPIMDQVFIHILRSMLAAKGIEESFDTKIPTQTVFNVLGKQLGLDVVSFGKCWKFQDGDMVCYEGPQQQLFIVYSSAQDNTKVGQQSQNTNMEYLSYQAKDQYSGYDPLGKYNPSNVVVHETITYTPHDPVSYATSVSPYTSESFGNYTSSSYNTNTYDYKTYTSVDPLPSSYTYSHPSASDSINLDIYKQDKEANKLVDKYLNMSTNPEDIIRSTHTTTQSYSNNYYTPIKIQTSTYGSNSYDSLYKTEEPIKTDYSYSSYKVEQSNPLLQKYSNNSYNIDQSFSNLNIAATSSSSYTNNFNTNPTSYTYTSETSTSYTSGYDLK